MALTIGQLLGGAGTVATRQRQAEEAERVARQNQLAIEEQNRLDRLRRIQTQQAAQMGFPQAPTQFVGFEDIGGAPPQPLRYNRDAGPVAPTRDAAAAPAPTTAPAPDTYYEDIYGRLKSSLSPWTLSRAQSVVGMLPEQTANTLALLKDPNKFSTEEIGRLYAISLSRKDDNTANYLRDVLLGRGIPDVELRNIQNQTRAGLTAVEAAETKEAARRAEAERLRILRGDKAAAPTAATANNAIQRVLQREGGYVNNPADRGGETKFGISKRAYPNLDIANITEAQAAAIYKRDYWDAINADQLPANIREIAFDAAVNQGVDWTKQALAQANNDPQQFLQLREQRYRDIVASNPSQGQFLQGWLNRLRDVAGGVVEAVVPTAAAAPAAAPAAAGVKPAGVPTRRTAEQVSSFYAANPQNIGPDRQNLDQLYQQQRARLSAQYNAYVQSGMGPQANELVARVTELDQKYRSERLMLDGMEAIAQLEYGNDPRAISAVLSFYRGQPVNFELIEDGRYRMTMQDQNGRTQQRGIYSKDQVSVMARQYFDRAYLQAQQAFATKIAEKRFESELKQMENISAQQAQMIREVTVKAVEGNIGAQTRAGEFVATNMGDGKVVVSNKAGTKAYIIDTNTGQTVEIDGVTVPVAPSATAVAGMGR